MSLVHGLQLSFKTFFVWQVEYWKRRKTCL